MRGFSYLFKKWRKKRVTKWIEEIKSLDVLIVKIEGEINDLSFGNGGGKKRCQNAVDKMLRVINLKEKRDRLQNRIKKDQVD